MAYRQTHAPLSLIVQDDSLIEHSDACFWLAGDYGARRFRTLLPRTSHLAAGAGGGQHVHM
jgi:hypothetical protein